MRLYTLEANTYIGFLYQKGCNCSILKIGVNKQEGEMILDLTAGSTVSACQIWLAGKGLITFIGLLWLLVDIFWMTLIKTCRPTTKLNWPLLKYLKLTTRNNLLSEKFYVHMFWLF